MRKVLILFLIVIFLVSNVSAEFFRGVTKGSYADKVKTRITDDVVKIIKENPSRFFSIIDVTKKGNRFIKASQLSDAELKRILAYEANKPVLDGAISFLKMKNRSSSNVIRDVPGKLFISRSFIREKKGIGEYSLVEDKLSDAQLNNILKQCWNNGRGTFYDLITKKNLMLGRYTHDQLKELIRLGPRQNKCIISAAR